MVGGAAANSILGILGGPEPAAGAAANSIPKDGSHLVLAHLLEASLRLADEPSSILLLAPLELEVLEVCELHEQGIGPRQALLPLAQFELDATGFGHGPAVLLSLVPPELLELEVREQERGIGPRPVLLPLAPLELEVLEQGIGPSLALLPLASLELADLEQGIGPKPAVLLPMVSLELEVREQGVGPRLPILMGVHLQLEVRGRRDHDYVGLACAALLCFVPACPANFSDVYHYQRVRP